MTTLFPEIVFGGARMLEEAAGHWEVDDVDLRDVTASILLVVGNMEALWKEFDDYLSGGVEGGKARQFLVEFGGTLDKVATIVSRRLMGNPSRIKSKQEFAALASADHSLNTIRLAYDAVRAALKPGPPPGFLERAIAALSEDKGDNVDSTELMARLAAGEDL